MYSAFKQTQIFDIDLSLEFNRADIQNQTFKLNHNKLIGLAWPL